MWYRAHHKKAEWVVCRLCTSIFERKEAEKTDKCPKCKFNGRSPGQDKESLDRIHGKIGDRDEGVEDE